jgi:tetratricopeptide (TPR) repeat protein
MSLSVVSADFLRPLRSAVAVAFLGAASVHAQPPAPSLYDRMVGCPAPIEPVCMLAQARAAGPSVDLAFAFAATGAMHGAASTLEAIAEPAARLPALIELAALLGQAGARGLATATLDRALAVAAALPFGGEGDVAEIAVALHRLGQTDRARALLDPIRRGRLAASPPDRQDIIFLADRYARIGMRQQALQLLGTVRAGECYVFGVSGGFRIQASAGDANGALRDSGRCRDYVRVASISDIAIGLVQAGEQQQASRLLAQHRINIATLSFRYLHAGVQYAIALGEAGQRDTAADVLRRALGAARSSTHECHRFFEAVQVFAAADRLKLDELLLPSLGAARVFLGPVRSDPDCETAVPVFASMLWGAARRLAQRGELKHAVLLAAEGDGLVPDGQGHGVRLLRGAIARSAVERANPDGSALRHADAAGWRWH